MLCINDVRNILTLKRLLDPLVATNERKSFHLFLCNWPPVLSTKAFDSLEIGAEIALETNQDVWCVLGEFLNFRNPLS
jgi:hypothetical protein